VPWDKIREARPEPTKLRRSGRPTSTVGRGRGWPSAEDAKRLAGGAGLWRLRVGDWRVIYRRDEAAPVITIITGNLRGSADKP
jgi:mRNA-degrading endonuclease RelE of RelBE toxin-antitoxin system